MTKNSNLCSYCKLPKSSCACTFGSAGTFNGQRIALGSVIPSTDICIICGHVAVKCICLKDRVTVNYLKKVTEEADPTGKGAHEVGAKLDQGKLRPELVLGSFAHALEAVTQIGTDGASKYSDNGWLQVPNAIARYSDAKLRHQLARQKGELIDSQSGSLHLAHEAWNILAVLELTLRGDKSDGKS